MSDLQDVQDQLADPTDPDNKKNQKNPYQRNFFDIFSGYSPGDPQKDKQLGMLGKMMMSQGYTQNSGMGGVLSQMLGAYVGNKAMMNPYSFNGPEMTGPPQ
jgi:hypothetical protein